MSEWTEEELEAGFEAALQIRAHTDTLSDVAIELACQNKLLLDAATTVASWVDGLTCGDPRFQPDIDALNTAIARTKGKP